MNLQSRLVTLAKWLVLCLLTGIFAGSASALFLWALDQASAWREHWPWLVYGLPAGGACVGWLYHAYGRQVEAGNNLIIDEIHDPKALIPWRMAPLILLGTVLTHVFGGSAGREGTAVQMGGSLADQLARPFRLKSDERRILLMAGMSAGFASVFGVPLAGAVFGLEVLTVGRIHLRGVGPCLLAAVIGHFTCLAWGIEHTLYARPVLAPLTPMNVCWLAVAGCAFGLCARVFSLLIHRFSKDCRRWIPSPWLRPFLGGILVLGGYLALGSLRYAGLGVPVIVEAMHAPIGALDFLWKMVFTVLTLGSGFKGGEVTPLLFVGATLGNSLATFIPLPMSLLAALGFVAVFAGAANTPWACAVMAMEIFGPGIGAYAVMVCVVSFWLSGAKGIYHAQKHKS